MRFCTEYAGVQRQFELHAERRAGRRRAGVGVPVLRCAWCRRRRRHRVDRRQVAGARAFAVSSLAMSSATRGLAHLRVLLVGRADPAFTSAGATSAAGSTGGSQRRGRHAGAADQLVERDPLGAAGRSRRRSRRAVARSKRACASRVSVMVAVPTSKLRFADASCSRDGRLVGLRGGQRVLRAEHVEIGLRDAHDQVLLGGLAGRLCAASRLLLGLRRSRRCWSRLYSGWRPLTPASMRLVVPMRSPVFGIVMPRLRWPESRLVARRVGRQRRRWAGAAHRPARLGTAPSRPGRAPRGRWRRRRAPPRTPPAGFGPRPHGGSRPRTRASEQASGRNGRIERQASWMLLPRVVHSLNVGRIGAELCLEQRRAPVARDTPSLGVCGS